MSQCHTGSGCSKDQENYDWTTAELISTLFITNHFDCTWFAQWMSPNIYVTKLLEVNDTSKVTGFHCSTTDERKPLCNNYLELEMTQSSPITMNVLKAIIISCRCDKLLILGYISVQGVDSKVGQLIYVLWSVVLMKFMPNESIPIRNTWEIHENSKKC